MKGFIEVTNEATLKKETININHIIKVTDSWITTTEMISLYECSGTNYVFRASESYEQIKGKINLAQ